MLRAQHPGESQQAPCGHRKPSFLMKTQLLSRGLCCCERSRAMGSGASRLGRGREALPPQSPALQPRARARARDSRQSQLCGEGRADFAGNANPKGECVPFEIFFVLGFLSKRFGVRPREVGLRELKGSAGLLKASTSYFFIALVPLTEAEGARVSPLSHVCPVGGWRLGPWPCSMRKCRGPGSCRFLRVPPAGKLMLLSVYFPTLCKCSV